MKNRLIILKTKIDEYVANGGSIYDRRENLPFYRELCSILDTYRRVFHKDYTLTDIFAMCHYNYDLNFKHYKRVLKILEQIVDENGEIKRFKDVENDAWGTHLLKRAADRLSVSTFDYVACLTNYRYGSPNLKANPMPIIKRYLDNYYETNGSLKGFISNNQPIHRYMLYVLRMLGRGYKVPDLYAYFGYKRVRSSAKDIEERLNQIKDNLIIKVDADERFNSIQEIKRELSQFQEKGLSDFEQFQQNVKNMYYILDCLDNENTTQTL